MCVLSFGKTLNSLNGDEGRKTVQHPKFQLNFAKLYPFLSHTNSIREGFKKREEVWSFAIPGGGGVSEGSEKTIQLFWKSIFFSEPVESF